MAYNVQSWVDGSTPLDANHMNHIEDGIEKAYGVELLAVVDTAPSECSVGDKYFNTTTNKIYEATAPDTWDTEGYDAESGVFYVVFSERAIYTYNGTTLVGVGSSGAGGESIPVGSIIAFAGSTAPEGYLMCDGSNVSRTANNELFNTIGTTYGQGDGSTTFGVPNIKGRVLVGLDSTQTEFDTLGETGGSKYLQEHSHDVLRAYNSTGFATPYGEPYSGWGMQSDATSGTKLNSTGNTGTGDSGNLQPYIVVNYIIKAHPSAVNTSEVVNEHSTSETDVYSANYVNTELNKKQKIVNYSTSEVDTGIKWIDNRPVYRKVINTTSPSSINSWVQIATINNLRDIIKLEGWVTARDGRKLPIQFSEPGVEISTTVLNSNIEMKVIENAWTNSSCMMIAEYTKTTD